MEKEKEKSPESLFEYDETGIFIDEDLFVDIEDFSGTDFSDVEEQEEQFLDVSDKIMKLNNELSEDIIIKNIEEQMNGEISPTAERINYIELFREKYSKLSPSNFSYDKEIALNSLEKISILARDGLKNNFEVELGTDLEETSPLNYLKQISALYEFFFVRNYQNLVDYFNLQIKKIDPRKMAEYENLLNGDEIHSNDIFVGQAKKKFKYTKDVAVIHFINEIINDIKDEADSGFVLFETIANLDVFEETNNEIANMLINYGNDIVLNHDMESARLYMKILDDQSIFNELRNDILLKYLETCVLDEN